MGNLRVTIPMVLLVAASHAGCVKHDLSRTNVVTVRPKVRPDTPRWKSFFRNTYLYPVARWYIPAAGEAPHLDESGDVPTGSFFIQRDIAAIDPADLEFTPDRRNTVPTPITVDSVRSDDRRDRFFGRDVEGRRYFFKLDHPDWPGLTSAAEVVTQRLLWALGYHVPVNRVCRIEGTGYPEFDGRSAVASEIIPGEILGGWKFRDAYRRREMRGLRVAVAWLNYVSAADHNTLLVWRDDQAWFYLLDFDNSLGSRACGPKQPWMGWRYRWDVREQAMAIGTLGLSLLRARPYEPALPVVSTAVGRFDDRVDPRLFRNHRVPNYAFAEMTEADAVWMARKLAQLRTEHIRAAVRAAGYSRSEDENHLVRTLLRRRDRICATYGVAVPADAPHAETTARRRRTAR